MKVRELIIELLKHPMNATVIIGTDTEGSNADPRVAVTTGCYIAETPNAGEFYVGTGSPCGAQEDGCVKATLLSPARP